MFMLFMLSFVFRRTGNRAYPADLVDLACAFFFFNNSSRSYFAGQETAHAIWDFADAAYADKLPLAFLCSAGLNRSPTALMSWLIARRGFTFKRARAAIQRTRAYSGPWVSSLQHMRRLEYEVHNTYVRRWWVAVPFAR